METMHPEQQFQGGTLTSTREAMPREDYHGIDAAMTRVNLAVERLGAIVPSLESRISPVLVDSAFAGRIREEAPVPPRSTLLRPSR